MYVKPVTPNGIKHLTRHLKYKHTIRDDDVPISLLKACIDSVDVVVAYVMNNSSKYGVW